MYRKIFVLTVLLAPFGLSGCVYDRQSSFSDETFVSEERAIGEFNALELDGNYIVKLENSDSCMFEISGNEEMKSLVITQVVDGVLKINVMDRGNWKDNPPVELTIKAPTLRRISVIASAKFYSEKPFVFEELYIESAGALKMDMVLKGDRLEGKLAGATDLNLRGEVKEVDLNMPGAGKISAFDLFAEDLSLNLSGAGKAEVFASEKLNVDLSGACTVNYKGKPAEVYTNISGLGRVKEAN
ncbi:MAG: hypothetical protein JG782_1599 [Anaerophaga sp.]|jgi:hypothetical protein|uniref:head GIN domain-containing protein n=1 Tax=Anaerophaga thermohalophila TaxID=177400 RepID=UPI000237BED7|nr:head GIN domain-containing protein [Anaerophaga thermohalophila]MBZ4676979.1 hypothetical protein [Anaerophaga sp.]MDI3520262.1 hypothetical protein [Anaerophaga sp.]